MNTSPRVNGSSNPAISSSVLVPEPLGPQDPDHLAQVDLQRHPVQRPHHTVAAVVLAAARTDQLQHRDLMPLFHGKDVGHQRDDNRHHRQRTPVKARICTRSRHSR